MPCYNNKHQCACVRINPNQILPCLSISHCAVRMREKQTKSGQSAHSVQCHKIKNPSIHARNLLKIPVLGASAHAWKYLYNEHLRMRGNTYIRCICACVKITVLGASAHAWQYLYKVHLRMHGNTCIRGICACMEIPV